MNSMLPQIPYALNLVLLAPPLYLLLFRDHRDGVAGFGGMIADSPGLRWLVVSFLAAIFVCSVLGMAVARLFVPVLILQAVAAIIFMACWVIPLGLRAGWRAVPLGLAVRFGLIAVLWPWFIWNAI